MANVPLGQAESNFWQWGQLRTFFLWSCRTNVLYNITFVCMFYNNRLLYTYIEGFVDRMIFFYYDCKAWLFYFEKESIK
jgi:hypothetical protein